MPAPGGDGQTDETNREQGGPIDNVKDLQHPRWMWLKAWLFVGIGLTAGALLILDQPTLRTGLLLALTIWAFCRAYYFVFYVIEHYIDPGQRYAGLWDFVRRQARKDRG